MGKKNFKGITVNLLMMMMVLWFFIWLMEYAGSGTLRQYLKAKFEGSLLLQYFFIVTGKNSVFNKNKIKNCNMTGILHVNEEYIMNVLNH
ncbi:unnamed protein product [Rhizophagus irregularis]|nr:unnamed protein product [Rhizophagus irregularis]